MPSPDWSALYLAKSATVRRNQEAKLRRLWASLGAWVGPGDYIDRWLAAAVPLMLGAQRQSAALAVAHANRTTGGAAALALEDFTGDALRGVDHVGTYQRGFSTVRKALESGAPFDVAVRRGLDRQLDIAATDVQLARTRASEAALRANGVKRYRRMLTGAENCGLCVAAASKFYTTSELSPIHGHCDCAVVGVVEANAAEAEAEVAAVESRYADVLREAGVTDAKSLMRTVEVHEHGELGPVLTYRRHDFKGPRQSHQGTPI
jgi:hypothetical protein